VPERLLAGNTTFKPPPVVRGDVPRANCRSRPGAVVRRGAPAAESGCVFAARLILGLADGLSYREIEHRLGPSAPTVIFPDSPLTSLERFKGLLAKPQFLSRKLSAELARRELNGSNMRPEAHDEHWT